MPRRLENLSLVSVQEFFEEAAKAARHASCQRARCGSVVVSRSGMIGSGYNAPPLNDESQRTCEAEWNLEKPKIRQDMLRTCAEMERSH